MTRFPRKLALLPALILVLLCPPLIKTGIGDVQAYPVRYAIKKWEKAHRLPTNAELEQAINSINKALSWDPKNPEYIDFQGRLHHYQALIAENDLIHHSALQNALEAYRASTGIRPHWPYSWANLALIKAYQFRFDDEYKHALYEATRLGPWENTVNLTLTEAGILGWTELNKHERQLVIDNVIRGNHRNLKHIKVILNRYNRLSLVCAYLPKDSNRRKLCGF